VSRPLLRQNCQQQTIAALFPPSLRPLLLLLSGRITLPEAMTGHKAMAHQKHLKNIFFSWGRQHGGSYGLRTGQVLFMSLWVWVVGLAVVSASIVALREGGVDGAWWALLGCFGQDRQIICLFSLLLGLLRPGILCSVIPWLL
jgi:hypothetical protein